MNTIAENFENWQSELEELQKNVKKDLEEIKRCKMEVQSMKNNLTDTLGELKELSRGKFIRDENRIILSAPEIIIGNVDKDGVLYNMPSHIVVRGNDVNLEASGLGGFLGGTVTTRASQIRNIAEDPGKDGTEHAVLPISEVVSQGRSVSLISEDAKGVFTRSACGGITGVELSSETGIAMSATLSNANKKSILKNKGKQLDSQIKDLESRAKSLKSEVESNMKSLKKVVDTEDLLGSVTAARTNYLEIGELYEAFETCSATLYNSMANYFGVLSKLAEANRQKSCIEDMEKTVDSAKSSFKDKTTGTFISMRSENITALSVDGDGNYRENKEAGVSITAKHVNIGTVKADESLQDDSTITMSSRKVEISTLNPKVERDDKGEIKKAEYPAVGDVIIKSKNIDLETLDYEWKDKKQQEKALTKDGKIAMRAEKVDVSVTDTEGKATGKVAVNAKVLEVKSMDVDKDKRTEKSLAKGSTMLLLSDKMYMGARDSKNRSAQVQVSSDKAGFFAENTLELQQAKAVVQLSGGNAAVGGGSLDLYGKTTLQSDVTAKGAIKGGDIEMKNMKVSSSFKSPSTSEGIAMPGAPATGKLSAKLKEEEIK
ncbi:MAG: hypothetical protein UIC45_05975 [Paludibacteraceae bacterium]|nr:hypothetical protein [Paludibacteraceae bacterium]